MSLSLQSYQNEYLPEGATEMHAVIAVTSEGGRPVISGEKAVVLVVDTSGSMEHPSTKIREARKAAALAVERLPDGTRFGLVAGTHRAHLVYPATGSELARADATTRAEAAEVARRLRPGGGTAISTWIDLLRQLLEPHGDAIRLAYLLTDGKNESESAESLDAALTRAVGVFQCDTRGVGADWSVNELRSIASALLGQVDIIKSPGEMVEDFESFMARAIGKNIADVRLRLWTPEGSQLRFLRQVTPDLEDLTDRTVPLNERTSDIRTGAWGGDEAREYHLCLDVIPGEVGEEKLAVRVKLMSGPSEVAQTLVRAVWTDDIELSTRKNGKVDACTGRTEQVHAIQDGLRALDGGDEGTATILFGRAAQVAEGAGDKATLRVLANVVEIEDARTGTVRLRPGIDKLATMELDARSTKTALVSPTGSSRRKEQEG